MAYAIGLDLGTGSVKAVAVDTTGLVIRQAQVHYNLVQDASGRSEQDPEGVWQAFLDCLRQLLQQMREAPLIVGLSSYMHGIMAVDENARPLTPILTWADTRAESIARQLRLQPEAESLYRHTGTPIHSMSPLSKLLWWQKDDPALLNKAAKFISIKEFIWYRLFQQFEIDHSVASATGLFDMHTRTWYEPALQQSGIPATRLSLPVPVSFVRTLSQQAAHDLQLPALSFCIGGSDGCLANLGSGVMASGVAAITIGTSAAVRITRKSPVLRFPDMPFNYILDDEWLVCGGPLNNGGNLVQWLLQHFLEKNEATSADYDDLFARMEKVPPGSDGLLFRPYLQGERAPVWDEQAAGAFAGIRASHTINHFLRAALEGLCLSLTNLLLLLEKESEPVTEVHISGGFTQNKTWTQMLADCCGRTLYPQPADASAVGAALLAIKTHNHAPDYLWQQPKAQATSPRPAAHRQYTQVLPVFQTVYGSLKDSFHQLYTLNH
jgi:gluconokinase